MEKHNRIIEGLERCSQSDFCGTECPYAYGEETEPGKLCIQDLCHDALNYIMAQERELKQLRALAKEISKLHSCNDCRQRETCDMRPCYMSSVRLNCPHWEGGKEQAEGGRRCQRN
ncbi:MAG: hypothetical protein K5663_08400 [Clostridiales bacterium]|nr:hypothetical protein [Clostridiales bacterium]